MEDMVVLIWEVSGILIVAVLIDWMTGQNKHIQSGSHPLLTIILSGWIYGGTEGMSFLCCMFVRGVKINWDVLKNRCRNHWFGYIDTQPLSQPKFTMKFKGHKIDTAVKKQSFYVTDVLVCKSHPPCPVKFLLQAIHNISTLKAMSDNQKQFSLKSLCFNSSIYYAQLDHH